MHGTMNVKFIISVTINWGRTVAQLVETLSGVG